MSLGVASCSGAAGTLAFLGHGAGSGSIVMAECGQGINDFIIAAGMDTIGLQ